MGGACIAPPRTAWPYGMRCGKRGGRTACGPADIGPSTACGWRRATGVVDRHHPGGHAVPGRPGLRGADGQAGGFIGREALAAAGDTVERRLCCLVLDDPLAVALGNEPIRIGGGGRAGHLRRLRLRGRPQHRLRLPADQAAPRSASGPRWRSSASGSGPRSRPSRYTTVRAPGSVPDGAWRRSAQASARTARPQPMVATVNMPCSPASPPADHQHRGRRWPRLRTRLRRARPGQWRPCPWVHGARRTRRRRPAPARTRCRAAPWR